MGPFIRSSNTKLKNEIYIMITLLLLILFSTYRKIITSTSFGINSFYPIIMLVLALISSLITSFIYSKITKNDLKMKPNYMSIMLFVLMLGINVPLYLVIIGSIVIEIVSKLLPNKLYYINIPLIVGLIVLFICHILNINPYLYNGEISIISSLKDIGTYESLVTPYGGINKFLIGLVPGVIGSSSLICLISFIFLKITKTLKYKITLSSLITISIIAYFTSNFSGIGNFYILYILFTSSTLFGILLISISNNTPVTPIGQTLYGIFVAILTIIIRYFISIDEAIFISIFLVNLLIPLLDKVGAKSRFHINKSLPFFTVAWLLIIGICVYMFINFKDINEFKIISKEINNEITDYVVSNENNIGKITVNITVNNNKITKFDIVESTDENINKMDSYIDEVINNIDNIDNIPNKEGYKDTSESIKKIIKNVLDDYVVYKEEINFEIISNNTIYEQQIYIVRNYDVKAKVIYKYNRLYNIEIIDMDSNDLNEINNTDFITKLLNTNSLDDIEHLNKSSDKLVELIKKLEDEK